MKNFMNCQGGKVSLEVREKTHKEIFFRILLYSFFKNIYHLGTKSYLRSSEE